MNCIDRPNFGWQKRSRGHENAVVDADEINARQHVRYVDSGVVYVSRSY
jgi:gamma-glutamyl phosphate reductase